jgi:hypothetical protein
MMVGTMAEGATSGFALRRASLWRREGEDRPPLIHWLARSSGALIGTSRPSLTLRALPGPPAGHSFPRDR